jgi:hypothetical protein
LTGTFTPATHPITTTAEASVTIPPLPGPQGPVTCVHADPWWKGVSGMDRELPVADRQYAAQVVALVLAARYLRLETRSNPVFHARARVYQVAESWRAWLGDADSEADYHLRKLALWQVCEHQDAGPDDILPAARDLHGAVSKGRRR